MSVPVPGPRGREIGFATGKQAPLEGLVAPGAPGAPGHLGRREHLEHLGHLGLFQDSHS